VFALRVAEKLDVIEHVLAGFFAGFVFPAADAFGLPQYSGPVSVLVHDWS
jgi:hypothetical protein